MKAEWGKTLNKCRVACLFNNFYRRTYNYLYKFCDDDLKIWKEKASFTILAICRVN